jgi:hypothetical protein
VTPREMIATLRRRWYVLAVVALCTLLGVMAVHKRSITYMECDVLFVNPPPTHLNANVLLNETDSLDATTGIVTRAVMSSTVQDQLQSAGLTASYDAEMTNTGTNETPAFGEPSLQICSSSTSAVMAQRTTNGVTRQFLGILHERQVAQHVRPAMMITAEVIGSPSVQPIYGRPSQAYIGVGLIGIVGGVALTLWSDPFLERRQRRKTARQPPTGTADAHA